MARDSRLGDEMPPRRNVKWGSMEAGTSHLSDEWHTMERSTGHMSEKYDHMEPSTGHMSDRYVEMEAGSAPDNKFHEMKQEGRVDPYAMAPSSGDRPEARMAKQSKNTMKNSGHGRYEIHGSEGQSGKGL